MKSTLVTSTLARLRGVHGGLLAKQRAALFGDVHRATWSAIKAGYASLLLPRGNSRRVVESFEAAVQRQGLTEQDLAQRFAYFRRAQLMMYAGAIALLVYSARLYFNATGVSEFVCTPLAALAMVVRGYLFGFRAWQVRIRRLAPLGEAVRDLSTYLVL